MSTREMELGCLESARGHVGVEKEAAGRSDNLKLYGTRAGERAGGSRRLRVAAHPCDRIGRPLSPLEVELDTLDPARGHVCVERAGKHRSRFLSSRTSKSVTCVSRSRAHWSGWMGAASVCSLGESGTTASGVAGSTAGPHLGQRLLLPPRQFSSAEKEMGGGGQCWAVERPPSGAVDRT